MGETSKKFDDLSLAFIDVPPDQKIPGPANALNALYRKVRELEERIEVLEGADMDKAPKRG